MVLAVTLRAPPNEHMLEKIGVENSHAGRVQISRRRATASLQGASW